MKEKQLIETRTLLDIDTKKREFWERTFCAVLSSTLLHGLAPYERAAATLADYATTLWLERFAEDVK